MLIYSVLIAVSSTLLLAVTSTLGDGEIQEMGQAGDIQDPCSLKEKNVSLASLSFPYYEGYNTLGNDSIKIYLSLCKPLSELPERIAALCDKTAFSCITKFNDRKIEVEYIRNGGSVSTGVREEVNHLALVAMTTTTTTTSLIDYMFSKEFLDMMQ
ncbi:uncharacterized protein LOC111714774 [Eurytemora carolleeae]|uniref:uncharacterized protein LOC111714774 n=1 Tax=Eurytemora carolleeae TaxID=1294199 RepID=UPI000C779663|nr:uncharacterized protein LOC111714774 [Eurytemora carolleeae]|eukprot:XP_023345743.1 uncharacterized protein LOC111714774 [Eurytemora affinis]